MTGSQFCRSLLMSTGIVLAMSVPAFAQQQGCEQQLTDVSDRLEQAGTLTEAVTTEMERLIEQARTALQEGNEEECLQIVGDLEGMLPATGQQAQEQMQEGAAGAAIVVEEQAPDVTVEEQPPDVVVETEPPDVAVETEPPDVQVDMPEPEVTVEETGEPTVTVEEAGEPEVIVREGEEAEVTVEEEAQQEQAQQEEMQPEAEQQAAAPEAEGIQQQLQDMQVNEIAGQSLVNAEGESIGEISAIAMENQTGQPYVIVETGGFLGIGARDVAVPMDQVSQLTEDNNLQANLTEEQLEAIPDYDEQAYTELAADQPIGQAIQTTRGQ